VAFEITCDPFPKNSGDGMNLVISWERSANRWSAYISAINSIHYSFRTKRHIDDSNRRFLCQFFGVDLCRLQDASKISIKNEEYASQESKNNWHRRNNGNDNKYIY